jgi:hypothetical protein
MAQSHRSLTLLQAAAETPSFARLAELSRESSARLKAVENMIPAALRASIKAGPIDGSTWCLLVDNNASAAKIRQFLPTLATHLTTKGWEVTSIRLRVQIKN